ncbi:MAG: T9SS type A sorting domain-containing protein [Flavobacteriales bacterium]|nr:T9SS type A sorting domain-containing protein [Flavobacteriales bacterium]
MLQRFYWSGLLSLLLCVTALAQSWQPPQEIPDHRGTGGAIGLWNSMVIVNGHPAIATVDVGHNMIRYVRANDPQGASWGTPVFVNTPAVDGTHLSLCVVNGRPAIAYQRVFGLDLMYVRANDANGDTWGTPVLVDEAGDVGKAASLAVVNGRPAISYYDGAIQRLRYVRANDADGTSWGTPVNPELIIGQINSTTLVVVNGNPAIGFGRNGNTRYMRATDADGATWNSGTTIVTGLSNGTFTSLAVVAGLPCMAYYKSENERVAFRRASDANGDNWGAEVTVHFVSGQVIGAYARVLEVDGFPAVAYQQVTSADVYYVRSANATGTSWLNPVVVDAGGNVGRDITVHLVDGRPAIAYYDLTNDDLRFVRATNTTGMGAGSWGTPLVIDTHPRIGKYISQAIVQGHPALAYYDEDNQDLRYIRALDSTGTTWGTSITVDSIGACGAFCSLAIVNGRPAISYFHEQNNVRYVRANDALGTSWGASVGMDNSQSGPRGQGTSLAVIGGRPAIAYQNNTNSNIRYVRANDADGTSWPMNGTTIGFSGATDVHLDLEEVGGLPAVAYHRSQLYDLYYERGGNVDWNGGTAIEVVVASAGSTGWYAQLEVVNGNPAIAFQDVTNTDLTFVRATTASGSSWGSPVVVDAVGGNFGSLAVIDGRPAMSYSRSLNTLHYVRADEPNGSTWGTPVALTSGPIPANFSSLVQNGPHVGVAFHNMRRSMPWFVGGGDCVPPDAPVSNTPPGNLDLCGAGNTTLSATGTDLTWFDLPVGGNALGSGNAFATGTLNAGTTYYVQDSTCAASTRTAITVNVTVIDTDVSADGSTLTAAASGLSYLWLDCNAGFAPVNGENGQSFQASTGLWAVQLTDGVCVDTSACVQVVSTGADEREARLTVLGPNPTDGLVRLVCVSCMRGDGPLILYDAAGRPVLEVRGASSPSITLDLSTLAAGVYVLRGADVAPIRLVRQ